MGKSVPRPPHYRDMRDDSLEVGGIVPPPGYEPPPRWLAWSIIVFWALVIGGIGLLYSCRADARTQVYLESEQDLGNGYKLCVYSEGVTITRRDSQLCPLSIEV